MRHLIVRLSLTLSAFLSAPAAAQDWPDGLQCGGTTPDWQLDLAGDTARLTYLRPSNLTVMLTTPAQETGTPMALTLIGRNDTAIVILEHGGCRFAAEAADFPISALVLTQRGETPVLLTGCCAADVD